MSTNLNLATDTELGDHACGHADDRASGRAGEPDHAGDVLMLPDELLLIVGACALELHLPTIFRARTSCKRLQGILAQLCITTEGSRRLQWVDELSLKVEITNLGSTVRSLPSGTSWACGSLLPPGSWQWSITLDESMMNETGQFIGVCNKSGTVGFGFHPFSGNTWVATRKNNAIAYGGAAATQSDPMFTYAFLGGHLQQILLPEDDGMEEDEDAMSGWRTNIREGARIDVSFVAANSGIPCYWLGFCVNGGPLRYAGILAGAPTNYCRVRPWVYMSSSYLDEKHEQLTSSPYLVVDTTDAEMRRDAKGVWSSVYAQSHGDDESVLGGESEGESEGESVDENGN